MNFDYIKTLHSLGVKDGETYYENSKNVSLEIVEKKIKKEENTTEGVGIRICENDRVGFAFAEKEKILQGIIQAKKNAKLSREIKNFSFAPGGDVKNEAGERRIGDFGIEELFEIYDKLKSIANVHAANIVANTTQKTIENTNAFHGEFKKRTFSMYANVIHGAGMATMVFDSLNPEGWEKEAELLDENAKIMNRAERVRGRYNIVFSPNSFLSFLSILIPSFSYENIRKGVSILKGKIGKKVFTEKLSIFVAPELELTGKEPFDDEGVVAKRKAIVENGKIIDYLYNLENSEKGKCGNCMRMDYSSPPTIGVSNVFIEKGEGFDEKYLYIKHAHGFHTANTLTGEFGIKVSEGYLMNGESVEKGIKNISFGGNIFEFLKNIEVGNKYYSYSNYQGPLILFKEVWVN
ncbi:MAG: TldD/PmbA family protein [Candidatus Anstonellales archaeon]